MEMGNEPSCVGFMSGPQNGAFVNSSYQNILDVVNSVGNTGTLSKAQMLNMELENARNQIQILTNQLNQSVS